MKFSLELNKITWYRILLTFLTLGVKKRDKISDS